MSFVDKSSTAPGDGDSFSPSVSVDGAQIAFASNATNLATSDDNEVTDIFLRTPQSKSTALVSRSCSGDEGDNASSVPQISSDTGGGGAGVSFVTDAANLLRAARPPRPPTTTNLPDVYFRPLGSAPVVNER